MPTRETLFGPEPVEQAPPKESTHQRKLTAAERLRAAKVKPIDRSQSLLVPLDIEQLIGPDHTARAIWALTKKLDLSKFYAPLLSAQGLAGRPAWDPQLLLSIWLYCYSKGESSARAIASLMEHEPGLMWLAGLGEVNHDKLSEFRRAHKQILDELFAQLLAVMEQEGLVDLAQVMHDGTKIRAQAGVDSYRRRATLEQRLQAARQLVEEFGNPADETGSQKRRAARERAAREKVERLEQAVEQLQEIEAGKKEAEKADARVSLTEPEARWMKHADNAIVPSYNVQISTDAKQGVIVGVHITQCSSDSGSLGKAMDAVADNMQREPVQVVADGGYTNRDTIVEMAEREIDFIGPMKDQRERQAAAPKSCGIDFAFGSGFFTIHPESRSLECPAGKQLPYVRQSRKRGNVYHQYQALGGECKECEHQKQCCPKNPKRGRTVSVLICEGEQVAAFRRKMESEQAKQTYKKRGPVAEFPNAWIKEKPRIRKFRLRGLTKAGTEALWACLTYNVMQWIRLCWRSGEAPLAVA